MKLPISSRGRRFASLLVPLVLLAVPLKPAEAKTLVFCSDASPESFYAGGSAAPATQDAAHQIYSRLVQFERGYTRLMSGVAERWEISQDGTVYTFHLRPDIKWQANLSYRPTRDLNADDVIFTIERQWKPDHPYYKVTSASHAAFEALGLPKLLKSVEKVNDLTVRITLTRPEATFLADLAVEWAGIQSKEYADQLLKAGTPEKLDLEPIGTGPFYLADYRKDVAIRFRAFPFHWAGRAKIDELIFSITPDASQRWAKLQQGECHVMASPAPADLAALKADKAVTVLEQPGLNVSYVAFNTQKPTFGDVRVRRALSLAIDKKALMDTLYGATAISAVGPIPPALWSYNKGQRDELHLPSPARKLLAEGGQPGGFSTEIWITAADKPIIPDPRRAAEMIQANLAEIGVKAEIKTLMPDDFRTRVQKGEHQIALLGWVAQNGDPDNFLSGLFGCDNGEPAASNASRWCDTDFQKLLAQGKANTFVGERTKIYEQAQGICKREAPWFPIAHVIQLIGVRKEVMDFRISPSGRHTFFGVDMKE